MLIGRKVTEKSVGCIKWARARQTCSWDRVLDCQRPWIYCIPSLEGRYFSNRFSWTISLLACRISLPDISWYSSKEFTGVITKSWGNTEQISRQYILEFCRASVSVLAQTLPMIARASLLFGLTRHRKERVRWSPLRRFKSNSDGCWDSTKSRARSSAS